MDDMEVGELVISEEQMDFLNKEFGLTLEALNRMNDDDFEELYNKCAGIEIEEVMKNPDGPDSERCRIASDIVDLLSRC